MTPVTFVWRVEFQKKSLTDQVWYGLDYASTTHPDILKRAEFDFRKLGYQNVHTKMIVTF